MNTVAFQMAVAQDTNDYEENIIYYEDDLSKFKPHPNNRPIEEHRLAKLTRAIEKKNNLHIHPMTVTPNFTIIDGHHRWEIAKRKKLRIYYIVSATVTIEDAKDATDATSTWTLQDYLHHWCSKGASEYIKLRTFWEDHSWLTLSMASAFCNSGDHGSMAFREFFVSGNYKANNVEFGRRLARCVHDFKEFIPGFYRDIRFITALKQFVLDPAYDHRRMMQKMEHQQSRLTKQASTLDFMEVLNAIYNWKTSEAQRHTFKAPRYLERRA